MPTLQRRDIEPNTPHLFMPTAARPVRAKVRVLRRDERVEPHRHPWGQVAFSPRGVTRLTVPHGSYIVPPSRAVWVPPGVEHAVTVVEDTELRTIYLHQAPGRVGPAVARADEAAWRQCRVLEVSDLLRALVLQIDTTPDVLGATVDPALLQRERLLGALACDELRRAQPVRLGIDLPTDKRLRALCEAILDDPTRHATLDGWARDAGASPRTVSRLFRDELGTGFAQWRQQVLLAKAVSMAAAKQPMSHIAAALGYASASAFSAMVRRSVGQPPSQFFS
jgi:AraC-like DNA-binding protein